jgi:hypothetical protein
MQDAIARYESDAKPSAKTRGLFSAVPPEGVTKLSGTLLDIAGYTKKV